MRAPVGIIGRFPPPVHGQAILTARQASLLETEYEVFTANLSPGEHLSRVGEFWHALRRGVQLRRTLNRYPRATVLWNSISPRPQGHWRDLLTVLPAMQRTQRVYGVVHWGDFDRLFSSPLTAATARQLIKRIHGLVFLSDALADRCSPWVPREKRFVVPNTIDESVRCGEAEIAEKWARRASGAPLRVLFLSNMIPSKGYADALRAVRLLQDRGPAIQADFVGAWESPAHQVAFEKNVQSYGLAEHVTHHGPVHDRERIKAFHLAADVFLLPTYYPTEAQPLAILEAMNAGTPIVATAHASIPFMVRDEREGLLVPPRDPEAIADAVERLSDETLWHTLACNARQRFQAVFSASAVMRQWQALIDDRH